MSEDSEQYDDDVSTELHSSPGGSFDPDVDGSLDVEPSFAGIGEYLRWLGDMGDDNASASMIVPEPDGDSDEMTDGLSFDGVEWGSRNRDPRSIYDRVLHYGVSLAEAMYRFQLARDLPLSPMVRQCEEGLLCDYHYQLDQLLGLLGPYSTPLYLVLTNYAGCSVALHSVASRDGDENHCGMGRLCGYHIRMDRMLGVAHTPACPHSLLMHNSGDCMVVLHPAVSSAVDAGGSDATLNWDNVDEGDVDDDVDSDGDVDVGVDAVIPAGGSLGDSDAIILDDESDVTDDGRPSGVESGLDSGTEHVDISCSLHRELLADLMGLGEWDLPPFPHVCPVPDGLASQPDHNVASVIFSFAPSVSSSVIEVPPPVDPLQLQFDDTLSISDVSSMSTSSSGDDSSGVSSVSNDDMLVDGLDIRMIPGVMDEYLPRAQSPINDVDMSDVMSEDSLVYLPPHVECVLLGSSDGESVVNPDEDVDMPATPPPPTFSDVDMPVTPPPPSFL